MSRKLKKLSHQYEFLKLELEEIDEDLEDYTKEWSSLFGRYFVDKNSEMWVNQETGEMRKEKPGDEKGEIKLEEKRTHAAKKVKDLYRKLSTKTHPDKGGNVDDFNEIREFYDSNNLVELLKYAGRYELEFELTDEDKELVEASCKKIQKNIKNKKNTMAYLFCTGDKQGKLNVIRMMESYLGKKIDIKDYPPELLEN
jgi:hypothetical protein